MPWRAITPDTSGDWINQRDQTFATFVPLGDKKDASSRPVFDTYSIGVVTNRDAWAYNFSRSDLLGNVTRMVDVLRQPDRQLLALAYGARRATNARVGRRIHRAGYRQGSVGRAPSRATFERRSGRACSPACCAKHVPPVLQAVAVLRPTVQRDGLSNPEDLPHLRSSEFGDSRQCWRCTSTLQCLDNGRRPGLASRTTLVSASRFTSTKKALPSASSTTRKAWAGTPGGMPITDGTLGGLSAAVWERALERRHLLLRLWRPPLVRVSRALRVGFEEDDPPAPNSAGLLGLQRRWP